MDDFYRIKRLPPYVFAIVNDLKTKARARGEDIIDLGMGNPDLGTPRHIVAKLIEAASNPKNHRYSASRGITRLRVAMTKWYKDRYGVALDADSEVIATIGAKEGIAHLALAVLQPGDGVLVFYEALLRTGLGERDAAFALLRSLKGRKLGLIPARDTGFDAVWKDPQFQAIRKELADEETYRGLFPTAS